MTPRTPRCGARCKALSWLEMKYAGRLVLVPLDLSQLEVIMQVYWLDLDYLQVAQAAVQVRARSYWAADAAFAHLPF